MFISDKIRKLVKDILRSCNISEEDYHIDFGEDCFSIVFNGNGLGNQIFSDTVDELKDCFCTSTEVVLIRVNEEGNLVLDLEIPSDIGFREV